MSNWCSDNLGLTIERQGRMPKSMVVYRAANAGWPKMASAWFEDTDGGRHRLELLGDGQQFVAYGIHPDTNAEYKWVDVLNGAEYVEASILPQITLVQARSLITEFERLAAAHGLTRVAGITATRKTSTDDDLDAMMPASGIALKEAEHYLAFIDASDYDVWIRAGMALHHEYSGSDDALMVWNEWSTKAPNYLSLDDLRMRWNGFNSSKRAVTIAWLLKFGREAERAHYVTQGIAVPDATMSAHDARYRSEFGNARRLVDLHGPSLRCVRQTKEWYAWTGVYWRRASIAVIQHLAMETILSMRDELVHMKNDEQRDAFSKFCVTSQKQSMLNAIINLASVHPSVAINASDLNSDPRYLGVANGIVDLKTGELLNPDPKRLITIITKFHYDPAATCPLFAQTVSDAFFDDDNMLAFFQRLIGYTLIGDPTEDILVIPYGNGSNGKSTILNTIRRVLDGHARIAQAATFLSSNDYGASAGAPREDLLRLAGARFLYVGEPEENAQLRESLIKSITGGEPIAARGIHAKETIEIQPTWVTWLPTNHKPIVKGADFAIWRRLMPVPFLRNFSNDPAIKNDTHREHKLAAESRGILRWCIQGALAYQSRGLDIPEAVENARRQYKNDMDLLADWLEQCCDVAGDIYDSTSNLWASWEPWARSNGQLRYLPSKIAFVRRLQPRFEARVGAANYKEFLGLRVRSGL